MMEEPIVKDHAMVAGFLALEYDWFTMMFMVTLCGGDAGWVL